MKILRVLAIFSLSILLLPTMQIVSSEAPASGAQNTENSFGYRIVFDRSYGQIYSIYDTGFCGYSTLATIMEDKGYTVFESIHPLSNVINNMSQNDILFLGVAKNEEYSDKDIASIVSFIQNGGKAIIIGEHTDSYGMKTFQNKLASHFGVKFGNGDIIEEDPHRAIIGPEGLGTYQDGYVWFLANGAGPLSGVNEVAVYDAAPIEISSDNVTPILKASDIATPGNVVAALAVYGKGKVAFVSDSEIFWNGDGNLSINYKNGTEFAEKLIDLLLPAPAKIECEYDLLTANSFSMRVNVKGNFTSIRLNATGVNINLGEITSPGNYTLTGTVYDDGCINFIQNNFIIKNIFLLKPKYESKTLFKTLIDERGHARAITGNPDSLLYFAKVLRDSGSDVFASRNIDEYNFDSYVIMNPLEITEHPWINQKNIRVVVAGDMRTTLLDKYPWDVLKRNGYKERESPANVLSKRVGISFSGYLATCGDKYENPFFLRVKHTFGFSFSTYNAGTLSFKKGHVLADGESGSWGEEYDFFGHTIVKDPSDSSDVYLIGYNDNMMVLGCGESITDRFSHDRGWRTLAESIADWLNFKYIKKDKNIEIITTSRAKKVSYILSGNEYERNISSGYINISFEGNEEININIYYLYKDAYSGSYMNKISTTEKTQAQYPPISIAIAIVSIGTILILSYIKLFRKKR